jgi:thiol-disulfide isomerase/thioredoxin
MRPLYVLTPLMLAGLLVMAGCARLNPFKRGDQTPTNGLCVGTPAPEIDALDFDGKRIKLSDQRGKVVAVVFWASWCHYCKPMIPQERALVERYRGKPFVLIGVNNDENHDEARRVMAAERMTWPIIKTTGTKDPINQRWKVEGWPAVYVIDANGIIRYIGVRGPALDNAIDTLLTETAKR